MSRMLARFVGLFTNRTLVAMDKAGNRYFTRTEEIDGESSNQLQFQAELEAKRERVRLNVAFLKKEEEERRAKEGAGEKAARTGKVVGPDLKIFIRQLPVTSEGDETGEASDGSSAFRTSKANESEKKMPYQVGQKQEESSEPTGFGESFRPGTWQPPA